MHDIETGPLFITRRTSYSQISWSLEAQRLCLTIHKSFWNITCGMLPSRLWNFEVLDCHFWTHRIRTSYWHDWGNTDSNVGWPDVVPTSGPQCQRWANQDSCLGSHHHVGWPRIFDFGQTVESTTTATNSLFSVQLNILRGTVGKRTTMSPRNMPAYTCNCFSSRAPKGNETPLNLPVTVCFQCFTSCCSIRCWVITRSIPKSSCTWNHPHRPSVVLWCLWMVTNRGN